jgi:hypothetical protein
MSDHDNRVVIAMGMYDLACKRAEAHAATCVLLRREVQELKDTVHNLRLQLLEQRFRGAYDD